MPAGKGFCTRSPTLMLKARKQAGMKYGRSTLQRWTSRCCAHRGEWRNGPLPAGLVDAQRDIGWAEHLVFFFPLWAGGMPALLHGFIEQVARPGFALGEPDQEHPMGRKLLTGRSARLVVTMGMPALVYRFYFRAQSLKALERNILGFVGIAPVHETLIGMVANMKPRTAQRWLDKLRALGMQAK